MKQIFKIAWRNIWRNKTRSSIVIASICFGLIAGLFASALVQGMMEDKVNSLVKNEIAHFQVHEPNFRDDYDIKKTIINSTAIIEDFKKDPEIEAFSAKTIVMPMMTTTKGNTVLKASGVDVENEKKVSNIFEYIIEGDFLETDKRNPIVISKKTAEEYNLKLRSKIVLTTQDIHGEIIAASFRVSGIYATNNSMFDKMNVYVKQADIQKMIQTTEPNEISVLLKDFNLADAKAAVYASKFPKNEILSWLDIEPTMRMTMAIQTKYTYIIVGIILFGLLFSLINTMLMAVLERIKEIGVLMAIGMNKSKIFSMVMLETILYGVIGGVLGLLISFILIEYLGNAGMSMDIFSDFGYGSLIYPSLALKEYVGVSVMVFVMTIIGAIYPALKALGLKPVEAINN